MKNIFYQESIPSQENIEYNMYTSKTNLMPGIRIVQSSGILQHGTKENLVVLGIIANRNYTGIHRRKVKIQILISSKSITSYSLHEKMQAGPGHHSLLSVELKSYPIFWNVLESQL